MDFFGFLVYVNVNLINQVNRKYLDYANFECRKRLIHNLVENCNEDINGNEMIYNVTLNNHERVCKSCTIHIVLLIIFFMIIMGTGSVCIFLYWNVIKNCFNTLSC